MKNFSIIEWVLYVITAPFFFVMWCVYQVERQIFFYTRIRMPLLRCIWWYRGRQLQMAIYRKQWGEQAWKDCGGELLYK